MAMGICVALFIGKFGNMFLLEKKVRQIPSFVYQETPKPQNQ